LSSPQKPEHSARRNQLQARIVAMLSRDEAWDGDGPIAIERIADKKRASTAVVYKPDTDPLQTLPRKRCLARIRR